MQLIEQAVFTSAETDRSAGYQVVATSAGVCAADVRELAVWGPSHEAMLDSAPHAVSINFHPLPSGSYCVSRTTPAGWEYSGRGTRVYTQCLIVSPDVFARFANNPFALIRAALAAGSLRVYEEVPSRLEPLGLAGRAAVVDAALLARLANNPGANWMASLVQASLSATNIGVAGPPPAEHVIAGLVNCLPPECRTEFSLSTGLKFSPRRPFRVVALSGDGEEQRRVQRLYDLAVLKLSGDPPAEFTPTDSWARFIQRVLKLGRTSLLAAHLSNRQMEVRPEDLPALGLQLLEELDAGLGTSDEEGGSRVEGLEGVYPPPTTRYSPLAEEPGGPPQGGDPSEMLPSNGQLPQKGPGGNDQASGQELGPGDPRSEPSPLIPSPSPLSEHVQQAHQAHHNFTQPAAAKCHELAPSRLLEPDSPQVLEMLEHLDDLVYEAIAGKATALEPLKSFWAKVQRELGEEMVAESRQQYLRYALAIWDRCLESDGIRQPWRAVQSLDVLCLLFDEA